MEGRKEESTAQVEVDQEEQHAEDGTPLETGWTFWYDKKQKNQPPTSEYQDNLKKIGTFRSIEGFWGYHDIRALYSGRPLCDHLCEWCSFYAHLSRPQELAKDSNYHLFREKNVPMWEARSPYLRLNYSP